MHGGPLARGMSPEKNEGASSLCPPVGVAEHGSVPFCPSGTGSWWARVALGNCSRLAAGVEQREVSYNLGDPTTRIRSYLQE